MIDTLRESIEDLQIKFAFQENTISELNHVIYEQQKEIDKLRNRVEFLFSKVSELSQSEGMDPKDEGPPPHY